MWGLIALLAALGFAATLVVITLAITILTDIWFVVFPSRHYTGQIFGKTYRG